MCARAWLIVKFRGEIEGHTVAAQPTGSDVNTVQPGVKCPQLADPQRLFWGQGRWGIRLLRKCFSPGHP